ncbi:MAG: putative DNA binding domain-containing protein [Rhodobacteraceae bacterium]|nr:putative DNA binding domain-containing protein [Paracoccaceae bacterium]
MTPDQIRELAATGESEVLEFKTTTRSCRKAMATLCAMLNQQGGYVLFGVRPDGVVVGQDVGEHTIEEVSAEIQRIDTPVFPKIERVSVSGDRQVIAVHVHPGSSPPHRYRGVSYRRVGNATRSMPADEYNTMLFERMHSERRWENQIATGWTVDDLDINEIRNTVAEAVRVGRLGEPGSREPEELLRGLDLMRDGVLFRAAAALFGKVERLECDMPQCTLRVARFRGRDRTEFLDNRQFHGNAFSLLENAERFLRETLPISSRFESGRMQRIDEPLFPPLATREALANALCHRDYAMGGGSVSLAVYDDRLEVTSTGPLHFGLTPEDLFGPHESRPWNPLIARTFYRRGIIEEWGRGTTRMADLARFAGLPRPEIEEHSDCVTVRFRHAEHMADGESDLTRQQAAILTLLRHSSHPLALRDIRSLMDRKTNERQVREDLATLKARGLIESAGRGRGARWKPL